VLRTPRARTAGVYFCFQQEYTPFSLPRALTTTLFMLPQPALLLRSILFIIRSRLLLPPPHYTSFRSYRHLASAVTVLFTRPIGLKHTRLRLKQLNKPRGRRPFGPPLCFSLLWVACQRVLVDSLLCSLGFLVLRC
jgi:hypothetical protein